MSDTEEILEKLKKHKQRKEQDEFEKLYEKYEQKVKLYSGDLIKVDKAEFIKQLAFYDTVTQPNMLKLWNAYLGK